VTAQHTKLAWLSRPSVKKMQALFGSDPYCFVGGCVRDGLIGKTPRDYDLATALPAAEILERIKQPGIRWIVGHKNFPITKIKIEGDIFDICSLPQVKYIKPVENFEGWVKSYLTTYDFTINALALFPDGRLADDFGATHDIAKKQINFMDAENQISEVLKRSPNRIIRYFRFAVTHGEGRFDPAIVELLHVSAPLLKKEYPEYLYKQMMRLLGVNNPFDALSLMWHQDILFHVLGFQLDSLSALEKLRCIEQSVGKASHTNVRLLALLMQAALPLDAALGHLAERWKIPQKRQRELHATVDCSVAFDPTLELESMSQLQKHVGEKLFKQVAMLRLLMEDKPLAVLADYQPHL
jgi:poly(A) polymerase